MFANRVYFKTSRNLLYYQEIDLPLNESSDLLDHTCVETFYTFSKSMDVLQVYFIPVIIVMGFLGNLACCLVLLCTHLKLRSSSYYLAALALADSGYLLCLSFLYSSYNNIFNLYNKQGFCQICIYLTYVFSFLSVWLVVAFTVERFIAVQYPLKKHYICTANRAKKIVSVLSFVAFLMYIFAFWITDIIDGECVLKPKYAYVMELINYVDTAGTLIVPVILIVGMNAMIARSLFKLRKYMQTSMAENSHPMQSHLCHTTSSQSNSYSKKSKDHHNSQETDTNGVEKSMLSKIGHRSDKKRHIRVKKAVQQHATSHSQHSINRMLLIISSVFIILNFPSYLVRLCYHFEAIMETYVFRMYFDCLQQFAMLLYYTNFSTNFLLYTMCGQTFRLCLKTFFCGIFQKMFCVCRSRLRDSNL